MTDLDQARPAIDASAARAALLAELDVVRAHLGARRESATRLASARARLTRARAAMSSPGPLDTLADGFGLTSFERSVLLLAAGPELVASVAEEIAARGGDPRPTFGLALGTMPDADWSALAPGAPLRRWRLVHLEGPSPTRGPITVDERVLHHLMGAGRTDPAVAAIARPAASPDRLPPTLDSAADEVERAWRAGRQVDLDGPQPANLELVAAAAAVRLGRRLLVVSAADLPSSAPDRDVVLRLLERESVLDDVAWAIDADVTSAPPGTTRAAAAMDAPTAVLRPVERGTDGTVRVHVPRLAMTERRTVLDRALDRLEAQDRPDPTDVTSCAAVFDLAVPDAERAADDVARGLRLWEACRTQARSRFDGLATVLTPRATWDDLVLPPGPSEQLRALVAAVRHRGTVLDEWGFAARSRRGLGTTALFTGPSGTGKTLAAEVVARELELDLVVVDLSQVVSKYIGETEKNLARVFDAAEDGAAVLLFDEADTLFGKRTEVKDSHDRYSNLEVGYLLQRMEAFGGLAVLTTNARSVLDQAFLRRLRAVVSFPYPDAAARAALWERAFGAGTPVDGLDRARLAAIDLPGGGIASAALTAAYLGAERGEVTTDDVLTAARWELAKHGRTLT